MKKGMKILPSNQRLLRVVFGAAYDHARTTNSAAKLAPPASHKLVFRSGT